MIERGAYLRAAHWFGEDWPVNFWNTDLERRAPGDFATLRDDGFNTVVLLVSWPGFAPNPTSGALDPQRLRRLRTLIRIAREQDLQTVLRLSFPYDAGVDPDSRSVALWSDAGTYAAWLDYFEHLWRAVGDEPNLVFGFFSWEDLWAVTGLTESAFPERLLAAEGIGYRGWLRARYALESVAEQYETPFAGWHEVPLPHRRDPGFGLFLEFLDAAWIERFFIPARQRFPKLSMEVRIDDDPVWRKGELLRWHSHSAAWNLPGSEWTSIYWSPAMGGTNDGETLTPEEAARRLQGKLEQLTAATGARPIFVDQFLVEDYTPGFERNGRIAKDRLGEFLDQAGGILGERAAGFALWTWRDYRHDAIANPEFFNGLQGWKHSGDVALSSEGARLRGDAWIQRGISIDDYHVSGGPAEAELCVEGRALAGDDAHLAITDQGMARLGYLVLAREPSRACLRFATTPLTRLRLSARSDLVLRRVQSTGFVQYSGMRNLDGRRKPVATDYIALNEKLAFRPLSSLPLAQDGWMERHFVDQFERAGTQDLVLSIRSDLPAGWPRRPGMSVSVDGRFLGMFECGSERPVTFAIPAGEAPVIVRIEASTVHRVEGDARDLGCHFSQLELVPHTARPNSNRQ